jgi:RNA polymerase sigma-70 factor (ECF subfamily)
MSMDTPWMEQELLAHAAWVRELARGLVGDEAGAEDLAQDTFVVALSGAPRERGSMRAWLAGIARRLAWKRQRDRRRESPLDDALIEGASTHSIERLELHELLAKELRALREPLRATLIERYVHGRSAVEIAEQSNIPLPTVRYRLNEGLDELRVRLDRRFGGQRETWMSALVLVARPQGSLMLGGSLLLSEGLSLSTLAKFSVGIAALVVGVWLVRPLLEWHEAPPTGVVQVDGGSARVRPEGDKQNGEANAGDLAATNRQPIAAAASTSSQATPEDVSVAQTLARGRCIDVMHRPIEGVEVSLLAIGHFDAGWSEPRWETLDPAQTSSSAADGHFETVLRVDPKRLEGDAGVRVRFRHAGYADENTVQYALRNEELTDNDVVLYRPAALEGFVHDADGLACANAAVYAIRRYPGGGTFYLDDRSEVPKAATQADGHFEMSDAPEGPIWLAARAEDGREGEGLALVLAAGQSRSNLALVVPGSNDTGWIRGVVVAPSGAPCPRARLRLVYAQPKDADQALGGLGGCGARRADERGRFAFRAEQAYRYAIRAADAQSDTCVALATDVVPGTSNLVLRLLNPGLLHLRAARLDGSRVEGFQVRLFSVKATDRWDSSVELARSDVGPHPGGEVDLPLPLEPFTLFAESPAWMPVTIGPLDPGHISGRVEVRFEHGPNLSGIVLAHGRPVAGASVLVFRQRDGLEVPAIDGFRSRVWPMFEVKPVVSNAEGRFELLAPLMDGICLFAEMPGRAPASAGPFALGRAGQHAEVQLELGAPGAIEGQVLDSSGQPVAGAFVGASAGEGRPRGAKSDEKGTFRIDDLGTGRYRVRRLPMDIRGGNLNTCICGGAEDLRRLEQWDCEVAEGKTTHFDLRLPVAGIVNVRLPLGLSPAVAWNVGANADIDPESLMSSPVHASEGSAPGTYRLELPRSVTSSIHAIASFPGWEITLEQRLVQPLDAPVDINFDEQTGGIEGRLKPPCSSGEPIVLQWTDSSQRFITCITYADDHGAFQFPFAPAGACTLTRGGSEVSGAGSKSLPVLPGHLATIDDL